MGGLSHMNGAMKDSSEWTVRMPWGVPYGVLVLRHALQASHFESRRPTGPRACATLSGGRTAHMPRWIIALCTALPVSRWVSSAIGRVLSAMQGSFSRGGGLGQGVRGGSTPPPSGAEFLEVPKAPKKILLPPKREGAQSVSQQVIQKPHHTPSNTQMGCKTHQEGLKHT